MEVGALVAAIVSACVGIYQVDRDWRKRRTERSSQKENLSLQMVLSEHGSAIEREYDSDLRRLGEIFKTGDRRSKAFLLSRRCVDFNGLFLIRTLCLQVSCWIG
jgi:hypothetical protein